MKLDQALELVRNNITNRNLIKHMIATQACMRQLARYFSEECSELGLSLKEFIEICLKGMREVASELGL